MSQLTVVMHGPLRAYDALAWAEVVGHPTPHEVRHLALRMGTPGSVDVPPGDYSVRVILPSGRTLTRQVQVSAEGSSIELKTRHSAHEWLGWPAFAAGDYPPAEEYERDMPPLAGYPTIWHRLWRRRGRSMLVEPWPDSWADSDGRAWNYRFSSRTYWTRMLEVGGRQAAWRYTVLPPAFSANVTIRPQGGEGLSERGVRVTVSCEEYAPEGLLYYLSSGSLEAARPIADDLLNPPSGTPESVIRSAVIGYYLLEVRDWARLSSIISNLAMQAPSLCDTAVLQGLYALEGPGSSARSEAAAWLVEATVRGIPAFTVGLFRLRDGLERLLRRESLGQMRRTEVGRALDLISPYAEASDWTKPYTTFYGVAPDRPGLASVRGVPSEWEGIEFLAEGVTQEFAAPFPPADRVLRRRPTIRIIPDGGKWVMEELDSTIPRGTFASKAAAAAKAAELGASLPLRVLIHDSAGSLEDWRQLGPTEQPL